MMSKYVLERWETKRNWVVTVLWRGVELEV